jgi:hypothetical protein
MKCWNCGVQGHSRNECKGHLINRGYDYAPQRRSTVFSVLAQEQECTEVDENWEEEEEVDYRVWPGLAATSRPSSVASIP